MCSLDISCQYIFWSVVRTTKMAYVDSAAKPPRDVRRKQALHGTAGASYKCEEDRKTASQRLHPVKRTVREVDHETGLSTGGAVLRAGGIKKRTYLLKI